MTRRCECCKCGDVWSASTQFFLDVDPVDGIPETLRGLWENLGTPITPNVTTGPGGHSNGSFRIRATDSIIWPQLASCKFQGRFYPTASGDTFSLIVGWADNDYYECKFTATDGSPSAKISHWVDGTETVLRSKINLDSTFTAAAATSTGITLNASLCLGVLLFQITELTNYDGTPTESPYLLIDAFHYRPLELSSGGGGGAPGPDVEFQEPRWGLAGDGTFDWDFVSATNTNQDPNAGCPPNESCGRLLTERPIEFHYTITGWSPNAPALCAANPGTTWWECLKFNGSFTTYWAPGSPGGGRCRYTSYPNTIEGGCDPVIFAYACGSGDADEDDRDPDHDVCWSATHTLAGVPPASLNFNLFHQGVAGQTIRFDLTIRDADGVLDQNGDIDSLGPTTYFYRPDQVNYDKSHTQTVGFVADETYCLCAFAQMKIDQWVWGPDEV